MLRARHQSEHGLAPITPKGIIVSPQMKFALLIILIIGLINSALLIVTLMLHHRQPSSSRCAQAREKKDARE
jgi:cell division protein FtsL